jgi:hypothetical protein
LIKEVIIIQELKYSLLCIYIMMLFGCQYQTNKTTIRNKVPHQTLLDQISRGEVELSKLVYRNANGQELSEEERKLLNSGKLFRDFYQNENEEIV